MILDLSHDLKNPMSSIQGYVELLMKKSGMTKQERMNILKLFLTTVKGQPAAYRAV